MVCLPGGFGTLDEALEVLTLLQTGKREMMPVVLLNSPGGTYWTKFQDFVRSELLDGGMISAEDESLYMITDSVEATVEELVHFYRIFHSMRYVRKHLVFRLNESLDEAFLAALNDRFRSIIVAGEIRQSGPLPEENDEPDLADKPRLVFQFDRRSHGQLREMINAINGSNV